MVRENGHYIQDIKLSLQGTHKHSILAKSNGAGWRGADHLAKVIAH